MPDLSFNEKQHIQRLLQQEGSIKYIFDEFVRNSGKHLSKWKNTGKKDVWSRNKSIEKKIEKELETLRTKLTANIESYTSEAWNRSHKNADELVNNFIEGLAINEVAKQGMLKRNESALKSFLARKVDGATISGRVWKIADGAKQNIDFYLQTGFADGRSASKISQDIRQLLKNPEKRFRRVRDENGKLVYSKPMAAYHPGTGQYRSSYKNALRLAATNTNEIYRLTDCERWSQLYFVLGYQVRRSKSNRGSCVICDPLVGNYPKDYVFRGWHPFCICFATPILMDQEEFIARLNSGNLTHPKNQINDIPKKAREYFNKKIAEKKITTKSYLLKNNSKFFDEKINVSNGSLTIVNGIDKAASDFPNVFKSAKWFALQGCNVEILPKIHPKDKRYKEIYGSLVGTRYEGKSPDLSINGVLYEHEGFISKNPKNALRNMLKHGLKQSNCLIIEDCGHSIWYYKKRIVDYMNNGKNVSVKEVWLLKESGEIELLYKKAEARQ